MSILIAFVLGFFGGYIMRGGMKHDKRVARAVAREMWKVKEADNGRNE